MIEKSREKSWTVQAYGGISIENCWTQSPKLYTAPHPARPTADLDGFINTIKEEPLEAANNTVTENTEDCENKRPLEDLRADIDEDCEHLRRFLKATWTVEEISERTQDRTLAVGEKLACHIVVASLKNKSVDAEVVLDNIVQEAYNKSVRDQRSDYQRAPSDCLQGLSKVIETKIMNCDGKVPVVTGFFGAMPDSLIYSVSRGYSDLCATLCAIGLAAHELQIWKEVDGSLPQIQARWRRRDCLLLTSEEAVELTYYGSEVIHPLTTEQLGNGGIPLRLKNVKDPEGRGTIIYPSRSSPASTPSLSPGRFPTPTTDESGTPRSIFMAANGYYGDDQRRRTPPAVTTKENITVINIHSNGRSRPQAVLGQIAERLARHDVTINVICSSKQSVSMAVSLEGSDVEADGIERAVFELEEIGTITVMRHMSIISVVGHKMRNVVGVDAEIFSAPASARVNINLISQGASEISISFVVKAQDALVAMQVVHSNAIRIPLHSEQESNFIKDPWLY